MATQNSKDEWAAPTEKFVAYLDIMGFKDYVYSNTHAKVEDRIESLYNFTDAIKMDIPIDVPGKNVPQLKDYLKTLLVSDSILICSKGETKNDLFCIVTAVGALVKGCIKGGIPIKGAVSCGQFTFNTKKSIYVGRPLINASLLESTLEFYGCVLDHHVEKKIEILDSNAIYKNIPRLSVPTKDGNISYRTFSFKPHNELTAAIRHFYTSVSGKARRYVDNSIRIYEEMEQKIM